MRGALPHTVYAPPPPRRRTGVVAAVLALGLLAVLLVRLSVALSCLSLAPFFVGAELMSPR